MDLELKCEFGRGIDNVRFYPRSIEKGIIVDVTRDDESENIILGDKDVERLYEYIGEYLGKDKESLPKDNVNSVEEVSDLLNMKFRCTTDPCDTLYTHFDYEDKEVYINVNNRDSRKYVDADVYLSSDDALTMAENIIKAFGSVGQSAEPVVEKPSLSTEEASSELQHIFYCATADGSQLATGYDIFNNQLSLELTDDYHTTYICLDAADAMKLSESITKVFGADQGNTEPHYMRPFKSEPVVEEYEAASKEDLDKVVEELKELKEEFHSDMKEVAIDWSQLNQDLVQVHVEISQIQNDVFDTNESNKVKVESIGKHIEDLSREVVAAMEHLATRIDENCEEVHSLKAKENIRDGRESSQW